MADGDVKEIRLSGMCFRPGIIPKIKELLGNSQHGQAHATGRKFQRRHIKTTAEIPVSGAGTPLPAHRDITRRAHLEANDDIIGRHQFREVRSLGFCPDKWVGLRTGTGRITNTLGLAGQHVGGIGAAGNIRQARRQIEGRTHMVNGGVARIAHIVIKRIRLTESQGGGEYQHGHSLAGIADKIHGQRPDRLTHAALAARPRNGGDRLAAAGKHHPGNA